MNDNEVSDLKDNSSNLLFLLAIILFFLVSPYQTESSIETVKVEVVKLSEEEKLQNKIDEANLRIQEAEEAIAKLKTTKI